MKARPPADREAFAALAARVLVSGHFAEAAEPILSLFAVELVMEGQRRLLPLHDAFVECAASPGTSRADVLAVWIRGLLGRPLGEGWTSARGRLRPVVRNLWFGGEKLVRQTAFDEHLAAFLTLGPGTYLCAADLQSWGIPAKAAFEAAFANLSAMEPLEEPLENGITAIRLPDGEEPSSLLLCDWKLSLAGKVLAVPDRSSLFSRAPEASGSMFEEAILKAWDDAAQPVSPVLYPGGAASPGELSDPGGFVVRHRPTDGALALLCETYACQARELSVRFPDLDVPAPVHVRSDGFLYCTWPDGRDALLPDVSSVIFRPASRSGPRQIGWNSLSNILGSTGFAAEPGLFPPRFRARAWSEKDFAAYEADEPVAGEEMPPAAEYEWYEAEEDSESGEEDEEDREVRLDGHAPPEVNGEEEKVILPPAEVRAALETQSSSSGSHACRLLEALVSAGQLELSSRASLRAIESELADVLEQGRADWVPIARSVSARLLEMPAVSELFLDDQELAVVLARTAPESTAAQPGDPLLAKARLLVRDLLSSGGAEPVRGGSKEDVVQAVAEVLATSDDPLMLATAIHTRLDQMDEDIVVLTDAFGVSRLLGR